MRHQNIIHAMGNDWFWHLEIKKMKGDGNNYFINLRTYF